MPTEITMPQQSDTMTEGTLVKWLKKEGDKVKAGETVAEVETDKATMEMESFEGGTLATILLPEGQKAAVGAVIAVLAKGTENPADIKKQYASGAAKSKPTAAAPSATASPAATARGSMEGASKPSGGPTATALLESPNTAEMKEPDNADAHACAREPATPVPALSNGNNTNGGR